ncbi:MAG: SIS domain-containing protein [Eubacteriales bacterium]
MINLEKEIREQPVVLANVKKLNEDTIKAILADVKQSDITNVYFAARGTSDHACIYAQYLLGILVGIPAALGTPSVVSQYGGKLCLKHSLVVGVSQSGAAADVLEVIRRGNECGTITVAVTNVNDSPLAKEAKYHLYCGAGHEASIAATKTFTSQMYVLGLLCGMWAENEEFLAGLDKLPSAAEDLLSYMPEKIEKLVARYHYLPGAVVLGRGMAYPIALEGALKILETNRMKMKGYPISDFYHGPLAQLHEGDLAIVLAGEGPTLPDAVKMINRLNEVGAEVLVISDSDEALALSPFALNLPKTGSDFISPYLMAMTLQLIALKLTVVNGIDPDKSKVLNKVTITK